MDEIEKTGKLYLVPTPIGNMGDITLRAIETLKNSDIIFCEDTRVTGSLLKKLDIEKKTLSMHKFNEHKLIDLVKDMLKNGKNISYCSDAGTPGISDPGFLLIRECVKENLNTEVLPGATAFVPAVVSSGLSCERFVFEGFLPLKKGRQTRLFELQNEERTMVFYESPHRLNKTLNEFLKYFGNERIVCVSREISKIYEENRRGTLAEITNYYSKFTPKGEIVITLEGKKLK
ncbi:MAG: 16S rRNA (cytidine(1402)-2'-O)-methyltransferase [Bacteroidetes bacterium]|nr:16S rRNA (cytidine(1402)-2'-O)-methyltransferase [Bacteroidota bacterium]